MSSPSNLAPISSHLRRALKARDDRFFAAIMEHGRKQLKLAEQQDHREARVFPLGDSHQPGPLGPGKTS